MSGLRRFWEERYQSRILLVVFSLSNTFLNYSDSLQIDRRAYKCRRYCKKQTYWSTSVYEHANFKNTVTLKAKADPEMSCRFTPQDLLLIMLYPLSDRILSILSQKGLVSVSAHYTDGNIIAGNSGTLMVSIKGTWGKSLQHLTIGRRRGVCKNTIKWQNPHWMFSFAQVCVNMAIR